MCNPHYLKILPGSGLTYSVVERVAFFQEVSRENGGKALDMATIQAKIQEYESPMFPLNRFTVVLTHLSGS